MVGELAKVSLPVASLSLDQIEICHPGEGLCYRGHPVYEQTQRFTIHKTQKRR